jgi:hypothetical protein
VSPRLSQLRATFKSVLGALFGVVDVLAVGVDIVGVAGHER